MCYTIYDIFYNCNCFLYEKINAIQRFIFTCSPLKQDTLRLSVILLCICISLIFMTDVLFDKGSLYECENQYSFLRGCYWFVINASFGQSFAGVLEISLSRLFTWFNCFKFMLALVDNGVYFVSIFASDIPTGCACTLYLLYLHWSW